jgi:methylmalonyl-CoA mutase C-terminal domain/subunit
MAAERKLRILVGKPGLDGHDRGAKVIARAFRDAGFEVIYTGLHQTPEMIVSTAVQEDVDAVSLSILSGAPNYIVPDDDIQELKKQGVAEIFTPGSSTQDIIEWVKANVKAKTEAL